MYLRQTFALGLNRKIKMENVLHLCPYIRYFIQTMHKILIQGTWAEWRHGLTGTSWSWREGSGKPCIWKGKTPDTPEADQLKKQPERKVQEVLVDQKLPINQWCVLVVRKANVFFRNEVILLFHTALVRCIWTVGVSVRLLSRRETGTCWSESIEGLQRQC